MKTLEEAVKAWADKAKEEYCEAMETSFQAYLAANKARKEKEARGDKS